MKTKYLLLTICLLISSMMYSQNNTYNNLFDKYENEDGVTVVSISKAMFQMMSGNVNTGHVDIKNIVPKIESMLLITSNKIDIKEKMSTDFKSFINKNKDYEELMRVKDGKSHITFNIKKNKDNISELIMLINDEEDFVAIQILGNFTLDDIQEIAKNKEIQ